MSELIEPDAPEPSAGDTEEVDAVVVLAPTPLARGAALAVAPTVQAAAVAATSFVAGAAVAGLMRRHQHRRELMRSPRRLGGRLGGSRSARGSGEIVQIVGTRSLLVDVHLLGGRRD